MSDIVERLRQGIDPLDIPDGERLMDEAADEIERLERHIKDLRELREFDRADIKRLRTALQRIDGINDNPACFNPMIEKVLRRALEPKP